jgi:hypothetical protein
MDKIKLAKGIASLVVGSSSGYVVAQVIKNNTDPETVIDKIKLVSGTFVLGSMVSDLSKDYTDTKIDELVAWYQKSKFSKKNN